MSCSLHWSAYWLRLVASIHSSASCSSLHCGGRRRRGRAQHVVRSRHRRIDGPHSYAPYSARPCIARGSAHVRANACSVFRCRPGFSGQHCRAKPWRPNATKHRHRGRRWRFSTCDRLGCGYRPHWGGAAHSVPDHLLVDAPPTSGRCRSVVLANTPAPASQCCRSWLVRQKQNGRFSFTAFCWCQFRSCPAYSDLLEQSTARPRECPVR